MTDFPDDADGMALEALAAHGVDLSQPLMMEFAVAVPDEASANNTQKALIQAGYDCDIEYDDGEPDDEDEEEEEDLEDEEEFGPSWTVIASVQMVPEHGEIVRIQAELNRLAQPFGGEIDGWGVLLDGEPEE